MSIHSFFELKADAEAWFEQILAEHPEAARRRVEALLSRARRDPNGCLVTGTEVPSKVRFMGRQERAYRFVFYVLEGRAPYPAEVVRHRCNNRRCLEPGHLVGGTHAENLQDERDYRGNGIDFSLLL